MLLETKGDYQFAKTLNWSLAKLTDAVNGLAEKAAAQPSATVWVYKEYNDRLAYGEEIIKVFCTQDAARAHLAERVTSAFNASSMEEVKRDCGGGNGAEVSADYVSVPDADGSCSFWIVEKHLAEDI